MKVKLTMYKWAGKKGPFKIKSECEECDISGPLLKSIAKELDKKGEITIQIKPWLDNIFESLKKGGWHPPVIMINNKIFSQGIVPNIKKLKEEIKKELKK